jgi:anti-anti-sigma factor
MTTPFSVDLAEMNGQTIIRFVGEFDLSAAERAQVVSQRAFANGYTGPVIVDVSELVFCDSTGVRVLLSIEGMAAQRGRDMALRRPSPVLRRVLAALGMESYFQVEDVSSESRAGR